MIIFLIKFYFKTRGRYNHFKNVVVDKEHVMNAVKYANAIGTISEFEKRYEHDYAVSLDYAEYMVGHFVLNVAAAHSLTLFFKLLKCLPFNASGDDEKLLRYIGKDVWDKHARIYTPSKWLVVFDDMYGINDIKNKAFNVKKSTHIKFISSTTGWESNIVLILTNQLTVLKSNGYNDLRDREKLRALHRVAIDYGCNSMITQFKKDMENGNTTKNKQVF